MSEEPYYEAGEPVYTDTPSSNGDEPQPGSLAERIRQRREEIESRRTNLFPIPGYGDMLAVELQVIPYQTVRKIGQQVERNNRSLDQPTLELYTAAEQLMAATVGFWVLQDTGQYQRDYEATWESMAYLANPQLTQDLYTRACLIDFLSTGFDNTSQVVLLCSEWLQWMREGRADTESQLKPDFSPTP